MTGMSLDGRRGSFEARASRARHLRMRRSATSGNGGTEPKSRIAADHAPLIRSCARCEFCDKDLPGRGEAVGWDAGNFWGRCRAE